MPHSLRDLIESKDLAQIKININKGQFSQADFELLFQSFTDPKYSSVLTEVISIVMQSEHDSAKEYILQHHFERYLDVLAKKLQIGKKHDQKALLRFIPTTAESALFFINNLAKAVAAKTKFADIIEDIHQTLIFPAIDLICTSDLDQNLKNQALIAYSKFIYYMTIFSSEGIYSSRPQFKKLLEVCDVNSYDELGNSAAHWLAPINTINIWDVLLDMYERGAKFKCANGNGSTVEDRLSIPLFSKYVELLEIAETTRLLEDAIKNNDVPRINVLLTSAYLDKCSIAKIEEIWFKALESEFPEKYNDVHKIILNRLLQDSRNYWDNFKLMQGSQSVWLKLTKSSLIEIMKRFAVKDARFLNAWFEIYREHPGYDPNNTVFIEQVAGSLCHWLFPDVNRLIKSANLTHENAAILKFIAEHGVFYGPNEIQLLKNNSPTSLYTLDMFLVTLPGQSESLLESAARADNVAAILKVFKYSYKQGLQPKNFEAVAEKTLRILVDNYRVNNSGKHKLDYNDLLDYLDSFWFGAEAKLASKVHIWEANPIMTPAYLATTSSNGYEEMPDSGTEHEEESCCRLNPMHN